MGTERGLVGLGRKNVLSCMHLGFWGKFTNYIILPVYRL
jgi:hypothetical protein